MLSFQLLVHIKQLRVVSFVPISPFKLFMQHKVNSLSNLNAVAIDRLDVSDFNPVPSVHFVADHHFQVFFFCPLACCELRHYLHVLGLEIRTLFVLEAPGKDVPINFAEWCVTNEFKQKLCFIFVHFIDLI